MTTATETPTSRRRIGERWPAPARVAVLAAVLAGLGAAAYAAGTAGAFSSGDRGLARRIADPATRLEATAALAARISTDLGQGGPVLPGVQDEQPCPAAWSTQASSVLGPLSALEAADVMDGAAAHLRAGGWRITADARTGTTPTVTATNRRGLVVTIAEAPGSVAAQISVRVQVPCAQGGRRAPAATTSVAPAGA